MKIRRANNGDLDEILQLLSSVLEIHANLRPDLFINGKTKYTREDLSKMIDDDVNPIFIADIDGKATGYCFCEIKDNPATNNTYAKKELYIDDLCVDENYRGKGVAKELFEYVKKFAVTNHFDCITLNVWAGNDRAENFYKKQGFVPRKTMMEIAL